MDRNIIYDMDTEDADGPKSFNRGEVKAVVAVKYNNANHQLLLAFLFS